MFHVDIKIGNTKLQHVLTKQLQERIFTQRKFNNDSYE